MSDAAWRNPTPEATAQVDRYLAEATRGHAYSVPAPGKTKEGRAILECPPEQRIDFLRVIISRPSKYSGEVVALGNLCNLLLKKKTTFSESEMFEIVSGLWERVNGPLVDVIEAYARSATLTTGLREALVKCRNQTKQRGTYIQEYRILSDRLDRLIGDDDSLPLQKGEAWADAALATLRSAESRVRAAWIDLFYECKQATASQPTAKWLATIRTFLEVIGEDTFRARLGEWLDLTDLPAKASFNSTNADTLKGLAWCCSMFPDKSLARGLSRLGQIAYRKVPDVGPRAPKVGNACIYSLGVMPGEDGIAQLAIIKVRVKFGTAQKLIEKALTETAERLGITRNEVEEISVPSYGMEDVGLRRESLGDFTAELHVSGDGGTELRWFKADGKPQKSVPAAVREHHAEALAELKSAAKDIEKMVVAQKERIDNLFLAQQTWPLETWRQRYLNHPLIGVLARRLIWQFTTGDASRSGIYLDGELVGKDDQPVSQVPDTRVELWHPIGRPAQEVAAWRNWLERHELRQPFKQAHREVYVLTAAEERTRLYSNRYASHILRQHQFNALCAARGWKNKLRLLVDDEYPPASKSLPLWNVRAEFWIEGAGQEYGVDTNDTGTFLHLSTDQVRFYPLDAAMRTAHAAGGGYGPGWRATTLTDPLPLAEIPPLVFSEVMRDVDLFVGVSSVGNDPTWSDGGPEGRYVDYWHGFSFGELTETARTRRQVLERIIPRLKIADRCHFEDRFLVVRGDIRSYKIHLGSGNILMTPNDQYLCIVASQRVDAGKQKVFLPFEGDNQLSIILSKALLLAEDTKIADATIVQQIRPK